MDFLLFFTINYHYEVRYQRLRKIKSFHVKLCYKLLLNSQYLTILEALFGGGRVTTIPPKCKVT